MYQQAHNPVLLIATVSYTFGVKVYLELSYRHSKFHTDKMCPNLINFQSAKVSESLRIKKERSMPGDWMKVDSWAQVTLMSALSSTLFLQLTISELQIRLLQVMTLWLLWWMKFNQGRHWKWNKTMSKNSKKTLCSITRPTSDHICILS